jgi:phospholipid/cholesterol/gamma-HCH transport system substrate-binding protein
MTARKLKALSAAAVVTALAVAGSLLVLGGHAPYTVQVYVLSADRLVPGNNVDADGVPVGQVTSVQLAPENQAAGAIVTIEIHGRYAPLGQGTRALITSDSVLGEMFMELDPVQSGRPIPSGGTIPLQDTQASVTLNQVTDIFNAGTRQELATLIQQGGVALHGRGQDLNHVLAMLPQISSNLAATTGALDQQTQQLSELDAEFNRVATMIAAEHHGLEGDVSNGASVLNTLAAHQASLQTLLQEANNSFGQANAALAGRQQAVHTLLAELPQLLQVLRILQAHAATAAATINPCMQSLLTALDYLASAGHYRQAAGSADGSGNMLRVNPQLAGPESGSFSTGASCSSGGG